MASVLVLLLSLLTPETSATARSLSRQLAEAEQAFKRGEYRVVLQRLNQIPDAAPQARRARFLRGFAHYRLGQLEQAKQTMDQQPRQPFSNRDALLRGLVALARAELARAERELSAVIARGEQPWSENAAKVLTRVRHQREQQERDVQRRFDQGLEAVSRQIRAGRDQDALRTLDRLDRIKPGQLMPLYYRGLIAYHAGRYDAAARHLRQARTVAPDDGWTRYMLALTVARKGDPAAAERQLAELLSRPAEPEVQRKARVALQNLRLMHSSSQPRQGTGLTVQLEGSAGVDSNPAYLDELPSGGTPALGLQLGAALRLQHRIAGPIGARWTLQGLERNYATGGDGLAQTELSLGAGLTYGRDLSPDTALGVSLAYRYELVLRDHGLLLSTHMGELEAALNPRPWLQLALVTGCGWRAVHDDGYRHLQGLLARGELSLSVIRGRIRAAVAYGVTREWNSPQSWEVQIPHQAAQGGADVTAGDAARSTASGPAPFGPGSPWRPPDGSTGDYTTWVWETDHSFTGHGPRLWSEIALPWQLRLAGSFEVGWRVFDHADVLVDATASGATQTLEIRQDIQLVARLELARPLGKGLSLALRGESFDNISSLTQDQGLDRNYSRRRLGVALRWLWR